MKSRKITFREIIVDALIAVPLVSMLYMYQAEIYVCVYWLNEALNAK